MEVEAMEGKLPYYMVYPMPFIYDDERLDRRDYEYMRSLYPDTAKRVLPYVEEECDRCDGPDSMIYDEYPDRWQLYKLSMDILDRIKTEDKKKEEEERVPPEKWEWMGDMIQILLFYEIYKRRHNSRRGILRF